MSPSGKIITLAPLSATDGDFNGVHPNVHGRRKAAARLISVIEATTGWRAS